MTPGDSPDLEVAPIGVTGTTGGVGRGRPFTFARDHADFLPGLAGEGGVTHGPAREVAHCDETHEEARTSRASTAPDWEVDGVDLDVHRDRSREHEQVTRDAEVLTGYPATAPRAVVQGELAHGRA